MATSYMLVGVLLMLAVTSMVFGILLEPVDNSIKEMQDRSVDSAAANTGQSRANEMFHLIPVFLTIAGVAILLRESGRSGGLP